MDNMTLLTKLEATARSQYFFAEVDCLLDGYDFFYIATRESAQDSAPPLKEAT